MRLLDDINKYSNTVCEQIRWKKARPIIASEIENHIYDQRAAYIASGDDEKTATDKAILQMGDAVSVGSGLDKAHRPKAQWSLIGLSGILMLIGIITQYIINSSQHSFRNFSIVPYIIAAGIFLICYHADFTTLGRKPIKCYMAVLAASILGVLFGTEINGKLIWFTARLSPSLSYLSLIFPLTFALLVYAMRNRGYQGILISCLGFFPLAAILAIIPTFSGLFSGLFLFTISAIVILCYAIAKGWFAVDKKKGLSLVLAPAFVISLLAVINILQNDPYKIIRIRAFLDPYEDNLGMGYFYIMIRDFVSESVFLGKGGIPQTVDISQLPCIATDHSLTYLIYQFGFIFLFAIIGCVTIFTASGLYKALKQTSVLGSLIALSVLLTFFLQSFFYILDNLGYGLISPLSLPFISYGKSALFINAALTGFMLSVFRTGDIYRDNPAPLESMI